VASAGILTQSKERGYPSGLAQVWINLLDNAADAVNGGGEIAIQTRLGIVGH
jgi:signal transduction histidine kinase